MNAQNKVESENQTPTLEAGSEKEIKQKDTSNVKPNIFENTIYHNSCYKNLEFTVKKYGYNKEGKFYLWGIKVKNNYPKAVRFNYKLIVGNDRSSASSILGTLTNFVKPNATYINDYAKYSAIMINSSSDQFNIEVSQVCFEGYDCRNKNYVLCEESNQQKLNLKMKMKQIFKK
jgi:hypothetical protein